MQVLANGVLLDPPPGGFQIDYKDETNLFDFVDITGDYSWSFDLPWTRRNKAALRFANIPEGTDSRYQYVPASLILAGNEWRNGLLYFDEGDDRFVKCNFSGASGALAELWKNIKLTDLDWPDITFTGSLADHMNEVSNGGYSDYDFVFYNNLIYDESGVFPVNMYDIVLESFTGDGLVSPQLYVVNILQKIAAKIGYTLSSDILFTDQFRRVVLINNRVVNKEINGTYQNVTSPYSLLPVIPDVDVATFFKTFLRYFNLFMRPDPFNKILHVRAKKDILLNPERDDWSTNLLGLNMKYSEQIFYNVTFDVREEERDRFPPDSFNRLSELEKLTGAEEIEVGAGTIYTHPTGQTGFIMQGRIFDEIPLYFSVFRGMIPVYQGGPVAPILDSGLRGSDTLSTYWKGTGNMYDVYWNPFLNGVHRWKSGKARLKLTAKDLLEFDPTRAKQAGRYTLYVKSLSASFQGHAIGQVEAEVFVL